MGDIRQIAQLSLWAQISSSVRWEHISPGYLWNALSQATESKNSLNATWHYYHHHLIIWEWDPYMYTKEPGPIHSSDWQRWLWHTLATATSRKVSHMTLTSLGCWAHGLDEWLSLVWRQLPGPLAPASGLRQKLVILPSSHQSYL